MLKVEIMYIFALEMSKKPYFDHPRVLKQFAMKRDVISKLKMDVAR